MEESENALSICFEFCLENAPVSFNYQGKAGCVKKTGKGMLVYTWFMGRDDNGEEELLE